MADLEIRHWADMTGLGSNHDVACLAGDASFFIIL